MDKFINVVALNIPYPANYGGVIDIYYKLKALHDCGVRIILHCFEYERPEAPELLDICEEVHYYKRHTGLRTNLTLLPYNVYSRKDPRLLAALLTNDYPILFEGLHSCYYMGDKRLRHRLKIFRECNIEHDYYRALVRSTDNWLKKCFFLVEALRFRAYQREVRWADLVLSVSTTDARYLRSVFPAKPVEFIPCFHANEAITSRPGSSDFLLYHAKLSVPENEKAALFLIRQVFSQLPHRCIIAGMNPSPALYKAAMPYPNICIEANPSAERMDWLIREAHVHTLITFQDTGLKLKLLNSLFAGRHTLVNRMMLAGSGLDSLCHIADTPEELVRACNQLMKMPFDDTAIAQRRALLFPAYSNAHQAQKLWGLIQAQSSAKS